ncbi:hypothetical protein J4G08_01955, partial [Candidatus Poribacteria bacterium]|nr:hypothetical protein [Candidatus Poribacteria bacterium]
LPVAWHVLRSGGAPNQRYECLLAFPGDPPLQWETPRNHCKLNLCNQIFTHPYITKLLDN